MKWVQGKFLKAMSWGPQETEGFLYNGLAISRARPRSRSFTLTHTGTGHAICIIKGKKDRALEIATEIAECGNWDFDGLMGYQNVDPDIRNKTKAILDKYLNREVFHIGGTKNEDIAREVAIRRAG